MFDRPRIFISAVSKELGPSRQLVANTLLQLGYEPEWQDVFETGEGDLREMLRGRIRRCKGVVHLVGRCYGFEPPTPDKEFGRVSYTQFEALYAATLGKPVWRILTIDDSTLQTGDRSCDESEELRGLQAAYRAGLEGSTDLYTIATSDDSLKLAVTNLRSEVTKLRRRSRLWAAGITAIGLGTLATSIWLVRGQAGTQQAAEGAKTASQAAEVAAVGAQEQAVAGRAASESASVSAGAAASEARGAREAAENATSEASAARDAADTGSRRVEALASHVEIEAARATVEAAFAAGDRSMRGQVQAMERLLASGFAYTGAMMDGLSLTGGMLPGADFSGASIRDGDLSGASLDAGTLNQADLVYADYSDASLREVYAEATHFEFSQGVGADFSRARLRRSSFLSSDLRGVDFRGADLSYACLAYCDLTGADFSGADLSNATLFGSILDGATFGGATTKNLDVTGAVVVDQPDLTREQLEGLRRTSGIYQLDIKIWGDLDESGQRTRSMSEAFNSYYTDFRSIRTGTSPTITFRGKSEIASEENACVGAFSAYMEGFRDLRSLERFQATFWNKPGRAKRIKDWLNGHATMLKGRLADGPWLEGTGAQREAWVRFLTGAKSVTEMKDPGGPLMLNKDGMLVLLLAAGAVEAESINWSDATKKRLTIDAETRSTADSFEPLFHPTAHNVHLPEYDAIFRDWTLRRARTIELPQSAAIEFRIERYKLAGLTSSAQGGTGAVLPFGAEGERDVPFSLHRAKDDDRLLRALRWFASDEPILLPEPRWAYRVTPGSMSRDGDDWIRMRLRLQVTGIEADERGSPVLLATPVTLSHVSEDDQVLWEAPIELDL